MQVITLEPGIYFIPSLLKPAFVDPKQSKFLVKAKLQEYFEFGGATIMLLGTLNPGGSTAQCRQLSRTELSSEAMAWIPAQIRGPHWTLAIYTLNQKVS